LDHAARALALWEIGQLPIRYALAIDSRNLEMMVQTFSEKSDAGRWGNGREGLRAFYASRWKRFLRSIHTVSNHMIELTGEKTAKGTVYCHAAQEDPETGKWAQLKFAYEDEYVNEDNRWVFLIRVIRFWYKEIDGVKEADAGKNNSLPEAWPTWSAYWSQLDDRAAK